MQQQQRNLSLFGLRPEALDMEPDPSATCTTSEPCATVTDAMKSRPRRQVRFTVRAMTMRSCL
jgi:hypothetical protein